MLAYEALKGIDWEWLAMDGAMTKAPLGGERTGRNPTDRGKQGTKRSLLTEANGVPVGLAVEGANRHDKKLAEATLESIPVERPEPTEEAPQGICLPTVQKILGHDRLQTTAIHLNFTDVHIQDEFERKW